MLLIKRIICAAIALLFLIIGVMMIKNQVQLWQALGFCLFVGGITLAYIAIKQTLPNYNFWITLIALGLAYALLVDKSVATDEKKENLLASKSSKQEEQSQQVYETKVKKEKKKKKAAGFNFSAYPKISGSISVISAHIFYIGGRYVRLYGVDAPDTDQICSDGSGRTYNCGEEAASWVRGWIDKNPIECYILKVEPKGKDLATCIWGDYDIGAALVGAGWGVANTKETQIYKPYEVKAQNESSGLWQGTFYSPEDWRDIKRRKNDFTIKRTITKKSGGGFFDFNSWF